MNTKSKEFRMANFIDTGMTQRAVIEILTAENSVP
jgi:hypothetical protein